MSNSLIIRFTCSPSSNTESPRKSFYWSRRKWLNGCQIQPLFRISRNTLDRHSSAFPIYVVPCSATYFFHRRYSHTRGIVSSVSDFSSHENSTDVGEEGVLYKTSRRKYRTCDCSSELFSCVSLNCLR